MTDTKFYEISRNKAHVRGVSQERNLESDEIAMGSAINPRIPIVDDDENVLEENVLEKATTLIRRLGYTALIASNGGGARRPTIAAAFVPKPHRAKT